MLPIINHIKAGFTNLPALNFAKSISDFIQNHLRMDVWTLIIHLMCAGLIMVCITVWVWKPTNEFIEANRRRLDKDKRDLVINTREAKYFVGLLKKQRNELFYLKRNVESEAKELAANIITNAKQIAEESTVRIKKEAEDRVHALEEKAKEQIKDSVVKISLELTEKLIGANISEENNKALIEAYIQDLEKRKIVTAKINDGV